MEAIAAVEKQLAAAPEEPAAWDLKRILYNELTHAEYLTQVVEGKSPDDFDHAYVHQLGLALIADQTRWQRGCEYLAMAARGLPSQSPTIYLAIAQAHEKAGNGAEVWQAYEEMKRSAQRVGPKSFSADDRKIYFAVIKALGEDAALRGDTAVAIENFRLFAEFERAGINTYRTLADLYERQGDVWSALHATEQGLVYDSADKDFMARKDRYYFSVTPEQLQERLEQVKKWFDTGYCKQKARSLLEKHGEDQDVLEWASHLADLARVCEPGSLAVRVLRGRILRRRGEVDKATTMLEEVRSNKPEKFANGEEEEAWYLSCRLLGDLYLNVKPDQAVLCFQEYRKHGKSGADTVYKMGVAYENLGDHVRARKCYETVAAYESHPLAPEANSALHRLQA
jgi:predicted Zn-dependent protease